MKFSPDLSLAEWTLIVGAILTGIYLMHTASDKDPRFEWGTRNLSDKERQLFKVVQERHLIGLMAISILSLIVLQAGTYFLAIRIPSLGVISVSFLLIFLGLGHLAVFLFVWTGGYRQIKKLLGVSYKGYQPSEAGVSPEQKKRARMGALIILFALLYAMFAQHLHALL